MNKKRGFTLIEVVCAIAVLSITMIALVTLFTNSSKISAEASSIVNSSTVAQSNIENNNGSLVTSKNISFDFGDGTVIAGDGDIIKSTDGNIDYSVVVSTGSNFNNSGWGSGEVITSGDTGGGDTGGGDTGGGTVSNYYDVNFVNNYNNDLMYSYNVKEGSTVAYPTPKVYDELTYVGKDNKDTDLNSVTKNVTVYYYYEEKPTITVNYYLDGYYYSYEEKLVDYNGSFNVSDLKSISSYEFSAAYKYNRGFYSISLPLTNVIADDTIYVDYAKAKPAACSVISSKQTLYSYQGNYFYDEEYHVKGNDYDYYVYKYNSTTNKFELYTIYYTYKDFVASDYYKNSVIESCD